MSSWLTICEECGTGGSISPVYSFVSVNGHVVGDDPEEHMKKWNKCEKCGSDLMEQFKKRQEKMTNFPPCRTYQCPRYSEMNNETHSPIVQEAEELRNAWVSQCEWHRRSYCALLRSTETFEEIALESRR